MKEIEIDEKMKWSSEIRKFVGECGNKIEWLKCRRIAMPEIRLKEHVFSEPTKAALPAA
jgi:hypothetical protein